MTIKRLISKIIPIFMVADSHPAKSKLYKNSSFDRRTLYSDKSSKHIYPVIQIKADPKELEVQNLCLVSMDDAHYDTMELQEVIKGNRRCFVVLMYRESFGSGKIDVYYPDGSGIEQSDYDKMFNEVKMTPCLLDAEMELTTHGLHLELSFTDVFDRKHQYVVRESRSENDLFGMIAPIGGNLNTPQHFPLVYMKKFNFANKKETVLTITIDGKLVKPQNMIPFVNFHRVYLTRYSFNIVSRSWNPNYSGELDAVEANGVSVRIADSEYRLENKDGYMEVRSVTSVRNGKDMTISFYPALPDFEALQGTDGLEGYFSFSSSEMNDILGVIYRITKNGEQATMTINPVDGYSPIPGKPWMASYQWTGTLQFSDTVQFTGKWEKL